MLERLGTWKDFERLCADLLEAERFVVVNEPSVDTSGVDLEAIEEYKAHDPKRTLTLRWKVQCKHYAPSGRRLDRAEMEAILVAFEAVRRTDDGLLIMISTDYTEPARRVWDEYARNHASVRIQVWNARQILAKLDRYPHIARRYGIAEGATSDDRAIFNSLEGFAPCTVLFLSDQSPLAHDLAEGCARAGFTISFLPVWNYLDRSRLDVLLRYVVESPPALAVMTFGDSFTFPLPEAVQDVLLAIHEKGGALLFFPFVAWSLAHGGLRDLGPLCPVTLVGVGEHGVSSIDARKIVGEYRAGNYTYLLNADRFAEDRYVEIDPAAARPGFAEGVLEPFGISHSFEFLRATPDATVQWADRSGNPFVVTSHRGSGKVAYVNTCSHTCLSLTMPRSPIRASEAVAVIVQNVLRWLLSPV
jgi:hypothetical protein